MDIKDLSFDDLKEYLRSAGVEDYRAGQIFSWIYQKGVTHIDEMKNLPKDLRAELSQQFPLRNIAETSSREVSADGTSKFLFEFKDGEKIETVLIPASRRNTVCVSTQAGCKFGCTFCASGLGGFKRNLTCAEILGQILHVKNSSKATISHIVFMGTGEPLDNYSNVMKAIRIINSKEGLNIAARRITISTCGLPAPIAKLSQEGLQIELSVSLHGYDDRTRSRLLPINNKYPLSKLMSVLNLYQKTTKRQITFEYILIRDLTCSPKAAPELKKLFQGLDCKLNLIPYNKVGEFDHHAPSQKEVMAFKEQLKKNGVHFTVRRSRGDDISAACGQLRYSSQTLRKNRL